MALHCLALIGKYHNSYQLLGWNFVFISFNLPPIYDCIFVFSASMDGVILSDKELEDQYRCQTCSKTFQNIDALYAHQNELGHLELKQTPRGPGYLCWKKGCNQYFKTAHTLQIHFREIHAKRLQVSVSEKHVYKYRCNQCSLAFKTLEKLQMHSYYHIIRAATKCMVCSRSFRSIAAMRKHVESSHMESMTPAQLEQYQASLAATAPLAMLTVPAIDLPNQTSHTDTDFRDSELTKDDAKELTDNAFPPNGTDTGSNVAEAAESTKGYPSPMEVDLMGGVKIEPSSEESNAEKEPLHCTNEDSNPGSEPMDATDAICKDEQYFEDYINSQAIAEDSYNDPSRKYKCHRCKVAFTKQSYLSTHNKTVMHRKGDKISYPMERYLDPNRPFKCEVCKESFTQKNILLVHYNSVSHLHKLKQLSQGGSQPPSSPGNQVSPVASSEADISPPRPVSTPSSSTGVTSTSPRQIMSPRNSTEEEKKPFKCNICKVSYSHSATLDIHIRSVLHSTRASKIHELAATGQVDITKPLIEQPPMHSHMDSQPRHDQDEKKAAKFPTSQAKPDIAVNKVKIEPSQSKTPVSKPPYDLSAAEQAQAHAMKALMAEAATHASVTKSLEASMAQALHTSVAQAMQTSMSQSLQASAAHAMQSSLSQAMLQAPPMLFNSPLHLGLPHGLPTAPLPSAMTSLTTPAFTGTTNSAMSSQASKPTVATSQAYLPQSSPSPSVMSTSDASNDQYGCARCNATFTNSDSLVQHQHMFCPQAQTFRNLARFKPQVQRNLLENIGFECVMQFNEFHQKMRTADKEDEPNKTGDTTSIADDKLDKLDIVIKKEKEDDSEDKENVNMDMPEINKSVCRTCNKQFSSIWVLKAHQEEVHKEMIPIQYVESFSHTFKKDYEKKQAAAAAAAAAAVAATEQSMQQQTEAIKTEVIETQKVNQSNKEESTKPIQPVLPPNMATHLAAAQAAQMMQMPMLDMMSLQMNMPMAMTMAPPLLPMMMPLGPEMFGIPGMSMMDPSLIASQQQQHQQAAAVAAAQQNKRARTRINDEQLKNLRTHFDINNSPSEEQIQKMSEETNLPQKVIKHWFRNTLFKERQRNKDSPYNFDVPPSTTLNLEEYEKTGKISASSTMEKDEAPVPLDPLSEYTKRMESERDFMMNMNESANTSSPIISLPGMPQHPLSMALSASAATSLSVNVTSPPSHVSPSKNSSGSGSSMPTYTMTPSTPTGALSPSPSQQSPGHYSGRRANRTRFTDYQIKVLQEYFDHNAYPKDDDLDHLSKMLGLSPRVIVVWFQNARQKARKTYENQPPVDMTEDGSRFTRTPGLNYQCKKCFTVFQRYFELIKHQRSQCYKDEPHKLPMTPVSSPGSDSNSSNCSLPGSIPTNTFSQSSMETPKKVAPLTPKMTMSTVTSTVNTLSTLPSSSMPSTPMASTPMTSTPMTTTPMTSTPMTSTPMTSTPIEKERNNNRDRENEYKCDKCNLVFPRLELWREHQNVHSMNPTLFSPFDTSSAFGMLQSIAQQQPPLTPTSLQQQHQQQQQQQQHQLQLDMMVQMDEDDKFGKRKAEDQDLDLDSEDHHRDKRLRTTILPEQLDYLYRQYQIDCNPSRKQLESIATEVGLKKRVVQVWFQNTRARERKGQYRAHTQFIHKRCPICRALFRAKSALESHLATKHPEEMAKGEICVDSIPDASPLDGLAPSPVGSNSSISSSPVTSTPSLDMAKLLNNPYNMPNPFMPVMPPTSLALTGHNDPLQNNMKQLYEDSLKRYLNELSCASHVPKQPTSEPTISVKTEISAKQNSHAAEVDDAPLDLSKPIKAAPEIKKLPRPQAAHLPLSSEDMVVYHRNSMNNVDDSRSETHSESTDNNDDVSMTEQSNPPSPNSSTCSALDSHNKLANSFMGGPGNKRYRTQLTSQQIKVMKQLFSEYKTPTMAECEMLGREIGLPKRVVQVWFQNARAKEKKAAMNISQTFGNELDFHRPPEECKLCNFRYSHKFTIQDHIFTPKHIENVRKLIQSQGDTEPGYQNMGSQGMLNHTPGSSATNMLPKTPADIVPSSLPKSWVPPTPDSNLAGHPHLAQLHAMGLQATLGLPATPSGKKKL